MTLYDFMSISECDYDTWDTEYDASVTVCHLGLKNEKESYDKFCNGIMKKVQVVHIADNLTVDWTKLIKDNMEKFKRFAREYWMYDYEDDEDEFIYQWINEIQAYMSGYVSEDFYDILVELVKTLEA